MSVEESKVEVPRDSYYSFVDEEIHQLSDKNLEYFYCKIHYKSLNVRTVTQTFANLKDI